MRVEQRQVKVLKNKVAINITTRSTTDPSVRTSMWLFEVQVEMCSCAALIAADDNILSGKIVGYKNSIPGDGRFFRVVE